MPTSYTAQALHLFGQLNMKSIRTLLSGKLINSSPQELQFQYGENGHLFVYPFGCLVFFNMRADEIEREIVKLKTTVSSVLEFPTSESFEVVVGENNRVEFEFMEVKKLNQDVVRLVAACLGQSAGLEYFENKADSMLADTAVLIEDLARRGRLPLNNRHLLRVIGSTASTRQNILTNLAILDPPAETWKSKELEKLYRELHQNFDLEIRFRSLDRKLSLLQDNIEIIVDLASSQKNTFLEALIVVLIIMEILLALTH
ncbi:RMD1 family protein [bacterium]|nr:RMD1 family protein [bacterium]